MNYKEHKIFTIFTKQLNSRGVNSMCRESKIERYATLLNLEKTIYLKEYAKTRTKLSGNQERNFTSHILTLTQYLWFSPTA